MIRALLAQDAAAVTALIRIAFAVQSIATDPPSGALSETVAGIAHKIATGGGACIERSGAMIAAVLWEERDGGLYVGRLAVHPACRRQGLARQLMEAAEAQARSLALPRLRLGVRIGLIDNQALFASCGFVPTGLATHAGYTAPTSIDMEKRVGA